MESVIINIIPIELVLNNNIDLTYYKIKVQRISINKYPTIMLDLKYQRSKLQNISKTKKVKNKKTKKKHKTLFWLIIFRFLKKYLTFETKDGTRYAVSFSNM